MEFSAAIAERSICLVTMIHPLPLRNEVFGYQMVYWESHQPQERTKAPIPCEVDYRYCADELSKVSKSNDTYALGVNGHA